MSPADSQAADDAAGRRSPTGAGRAPGTGSVAAAGMGRADQAAAPGDDGRSGGAALSYVIETVQERIRQGNVTVEDLIAAFEERAFGALIVVFSLLACVPLPPFPAVFALANLLVAVQLLIGRRSPALPGRLRRMEVSADRLSGILRWMKPKADWIDRFLSQRREMFVRGNGARVAAVFVFLLALVLIPLSILPWFDYVSIVGFMLVGVSLLARDGVMMLVAFGYCSVALIATGTIVWQSWSSIVGWFT